MAKAFTAAQQRDGEVRLRLSPPELGSLQIDVSLKNGVVSARVEAQSAAQAEALPSTGKLTLEEIFLHTVGGTRSAEQELSWLG